MGTVYVTTQRGTITKKGKHLELLVKGQEPCSILTFKLDQLILIGNVQITTPAIRFLLSSGVEIVFLSYDGRFIGRCSGETSKNIFLRREQFRKLESASFVFQMARNIVRGKLKNQLTLLKRIHRTYKPQGLVKIIQDFQFLMGQFEKASTINQVRGYEGKGSALFFRGFPDGFRNRQDFKKRVRRPPTDPVNAVLSFCYTLLMNRVYGAVMSCGLDPHVGSLHALEYGRPSLALDLMEEFRTIIVDTLTLSLFNLKILNNRDFYLWIPHREEPDLKNENLPDVTKDPIGIINACPSEADDSYENSDLDMETEIKNEKELKREKVMPVRLKEDALKRLLQQFERKLKTRFYYRILNRNIDYERAIFEQARLYVKVIKGERETYIPLQLQ